MLRYAYDIGANSIGWVIYDFPKGPENKNKAAAILGIGVRVFSDSRDPKDGQSLASKRREPRGQRRRRDRYLKRRGRLMGALIRHGLMPEDKAERRALESLDPYQLRAEALDRALPPHHAGRAIFHLNQRRGFKSNRKTDKADNNESGKIKQAASKLDEKIKDSGCRTLGEYLNSLIRDEEGNPRRDEKTRKPAGGVRARLRGQGAKAEYDLYPLRSMIEAEFDALWAAQATHNPAVFTEAARAEIRDILLFQRPLKPVDPGRCAFLPDQKRAARALPLAQRLRIYQEANHLEISHDGGVSWRKLTLEERDKLAAKLLGQSSLSWGSLRKALGLSSEVKINLETPQRGSKLTGDETAAKLRHKDLFGKDWDSLAPETQEAVVKKLIEAEQDEDVIAWLADQHGIDQERAARIAAAHLPEGYVRLSEQAMRKILPVLEDEAAPDEHGEARPVTYHQAVERALGRSHSAFDHKGNLPQLPYYGKILERHTAFGSGDPEEKLEDKRYGRIANPSVHVALNQLRKLVNNQISEFGPPDEIIVEVGRELKLNQQQKRDREIQQKRNREANERRCKNLVEGGFKDTGENRMRLRLWEELDPKDAKNRCCPYSGRRISIEALLKPNSEIDIDHILPFSRTLDNSAANRTVCFRAANRAKTNKTPYEAFGGSPHISGWDYDWPAIQARAACMPNNKSWRFSPDAMEKFAGENDFLARHLTDMQYASRLAREYLTAVCPSERVWVSPGRLTGLLRGRLGLDSILSRGDFKNRDDYRHNALDAAVIGLMDRGFLNQVSREAARQAAEDPEHLLRRVDQPWETFRQDLAQAISKIVVSHKPEHGKAGRLHEDTAYGLVRDPDAEHNPKAALVRRKPVESLTDKEIDLVRDDDLRARLAEVVFGLTGAARTQALKQFSDDTGIRRVRLLKVESTYIPIRDRAGRAYKVMVLGDNHHADIYEDAGGVWRGEAVSVFDANQEPEPRPRWAADPASRLIMRLHKGDLIKLDCSGKERILRVVRLAISNNTLYLAGNADSGELQKRHEDAADAFRWDLASISKLKQRRARKVHVDPLGREREFDPAC